MSKSQSIDKVERYHSFMDFKTVDHPPMILPGGIFPITRQRWEREGLPEGIDLNDYFEVEAMVAKPIAIETVLFPPFKEKVIEENDKFIVKVDRNGVKCRNFLDESSMSEHLEYPVKTPDDIIWLRERLDPETPGRIAPDWLEQARSLQEQDILTFINGGMYFAFLNEHMGTEKFIMSYFDSPDFIHQVNELQCSLCEQAMNTALPYFKPDRIGYHEDMAYKNGSMISPGMFREFMTPYYKRITDITGKYKVKEHLMDSDGDIRELIPLWLDCGINSFTPLEVAAGMDVVALRDEYGKQIKMQGGFDKRILASTMPEIKREFERLTPIIDSGGYLLGCDHIVPHNVPFENYAYLVELMKVHYGIK